MPVVELRDVSKRFAAAPAVDGVSLAIDDGEFFSLLGPSGCGKTTTLRLIAGFESPDRGEVLIDGRRVNEQRPYDRGVGMVFQNYALFPHLDVGRNVAFGLERRRVPEVERATRVAKALEIVRLDPATFLRRMPGQLSGGQRQRVALARALVLEPKILLLDEPLGALDLKLRKEMQLELKALNRSLGITFVYVTHDQEEALTMSDRIAVMDHARIAQLGTPAAIYEDPRTAFVASFIGESNLFEGPVTEAGADLVSVGGPTPFRVPPRSDLLPGRTVMVAVRPEWMDLFPPGRVPAGENAASGTVDEVIYLGETLHVLVRLEHGQRVKVALRNEGQIANPIRWNRGDQVAVAWRPEDAQVLE
ncbi:MAG: ABC transporter ATP-binding protein [Gemmatimonadetes bacterium]|nr:ABC transporter ATP-binding protein [Gemmatimonadota bacterium]